MFFVRRQKCSNPASLRGYFCQLVAMLWLWSDSEMGDYLMRKLISSVIVLVSALSPLAAHADTIDDFLLTGAGHTISYSYPATALFPDVEFLYTSASATSTAFPAIL